MAEKQVIRSAAKAASQVPSHESALMQASILYSALNQAEPHPVKSAFFSLYSQDVEAQFKDLISSELSAARLLNVPMTNDPRQFIRTLEARIQQITETRKNVILLLDETSGTYICLNDEQNEDICQAPRELTWISDTYLQDLLASDRVLHTFLQVEGNILGIVAVADRMDGKAFETHDELVLEQLAYYLSVQINHYLALKRSLALPATQKILLDISNRLLCAVDRPSILEAALICLQQEMPFTAGQFIELDNKTGQGNVLYQLQAGQFLQGSPIQSVGHFAALLSLFKSRVWNHSYLYLKGEMLGDKSFAELFGLVDIQAVLVLPLAEESADGNGPEKQVNGALVLFQQGQAKPLSKEALNVLEQVPPLVASACARAGILEKVLEIATTDELTGAANRRGFYGRFEGEVDRARRNGTAMCLAILDIDHFKMINDTYGHLAGDQVLKQTADLVRRNIRKSDLLCRFGGEEFALMLPETALDAGVELLERLRYKVSKATFSTVAGPIKLTLSAGITVVPVEPEGTQEPMQVISQSLAMADEALYQAKQMGRNRVIVADA